MNPNQRKRRVLLFLAIGLVVLAGLLARPVLHLATFASRDSEHLEELPDGFVDDASRLNRTRVAEVWHVPVDRDDPESQIRQLLARANG